MTAAPPPTAREEWRRAWPVPLVAMIGMTGASAYSYSSGVFLNRMTGEFGWTHAQFSAPFTIIVVLGLVLAPLIGRAVDRFGSRRIALAGIVPFALGFSALGLANGSAMQWTILCVIQGLTAVCVTPVVWIAAVVSRFSTSRGMAVAIAQAGIGMATAVWPAAAALYIQALGWRLAFPALIWSWGIVALPCVFFLFGRARDRGAEHAVARALDPGSADRQPIARLLASRTFVCLAVAGGLFAMISYGTSLHMVPLLQSHGFALTTAAYVASLSGVATLAGRLLMGLLLDRFPAKLIAIVTFLVPILPVLLLWQVKGSFGASLAAVMVFGFTAGAESDVVAYMASRVLPPARFASGFAILIAVIGVFASCGPLLAAKLYDLSGSYDPYLIAVIPIVIVGALLIATLPPVAVLRRGGAHG